MDGSFGLKRQTHTIPKRPKKMTRAQKIKSKLIFASIEINEGLGSIFAINVFFSSIFCGD